MDNKLMAGASEVYTRILRLTGTFSQGILILYHLILIIMLMNLMVSLLVKKADEVLVS